MRAFVFTLGLTLAAGAVALEPLLPPFSGSVVIADEAQDQPTSHDFILSPVEKIRRELIFEESVQVTATRSFNTYETPQGTRLSAVIDHYESVLPAEAVLFRCSGRDCGRSNYWANQVFGNRLLYGPDANQHYTALRLDDALVSVYLVQRGNRRVYAHVQWLVPDEAVAIGQNAQLERALTGNGHAVVRGVQPDRRGQFSEDELSLLAEVGEGLADVRATVYVVCHLHAPGEVSVLMERAGECASQAVQALSTRAAVQFEPFAAGPLLPRHDENHSRIELVLPYRQEHD